MGQTKITMSKNKARIGKIGEYMTSVQLMHQGFDVANLNDSIPNMKSVDLLVYDEILKRHTLVQVKTSTENTFPVGFDLSVAEDMKRLRSAVTCAFVFVKVDLKGKEPKYTFYILSKQQMIDLTYQGHDWYLHKLQRDNEVKRTGIVCIPELWLQGNDVKPKRLKGEDFKNPLNGNSSKDAWNNIWL